MKKLVFLIFLFSYFSSTDMCAQKAHQVNSWWTYAGNHRMHDKVSLHTVYSFRRSEFLKEWQQALLRVGLNYHFSDKVVFTAGYDWVTTYPYGDQPIAEKTTEHRIIEQVVIKNNFKYVNLSQLYRIEQRFSNEVLSHRVRYRMTAIVPLGKTESEKQKFFLSVFNEVFVNFGKKARGHYFDQNWFYAGIGYPFKKGVTLNAGYMNQYLVKADNKHIESNHTPQFGISYGFDFRKKFEDLEN